MRRYALLSIVFALLPFLSACGGGTPDRPPYLLQEHKDQCEAGYNYYCNWNDAGIYQRFYRNGQYDPKLYDQFKKELGDE